MQRPSCREAAINLATPPNNPLQPPAGVKCGGGVTDDAPAAADAKRWAAAVSQ